MTAHHSIAGWLIFAGFVAALCAADLGFLSREARVPTFREAARWSGVVVAAAIVFAGIVWLRRGRAEALQFTTGYVIELSLSVDNLLVFALVLHYFRVPDALQPSVLKWGILGAIAMRGVMIAGGTLLLQHVEWVVYLLGALLIFTGIRLAVQRDAPAIEPENNLIVRTAEHMLPLSEGFDGKAFVTRRHHRWLATPLLLTVLVIEWTDLVFATDSIPAIFAVTRDPFLVYTSNIFAIVGLRALYFVVTGMLTRFAHLRDGVAVVLILVGAKMLAARWIEIPPYVTLVGVVVILGASMTIREKGEGKREKGERTEKGE